MSPSHPGSSVEAAPRVRVVVLNFNGGSMVVEALRHVVATDYPADRLEIVCVDNASTDDSVAAIRAELPTVEIRRNGTNLGFPGNNTAMHDLDAVDYVALVNSDAYVDRGWLWPLVEACESDRGIGAACPKILLADRFIEVSVTNEEPATVLRLRDVRVSDRSVFADAHTGPDSLGRRVDRAGAFEQLFPVAQIHVPAEGDGSVRSVDLRFDSDHPTSVRIDGGCGVVVHDVDPRGSTVRVAVADEPFDVINNVGSLVFEDGYGADRGYLERDLGQLDHPGDVFAWCGGAVLLRTSYLADVGLFDESYFLYYEDVDLSWRGAMRGWRYRTVPTSIVRHEHAASSIEGSAMFVMHNERNRLLTVAKDGSIELLIRQLIRYVTATASYARRDIVRPVLRGRRPTTVMVRIRTSALLGFLRLLPSTLVTRWAMRRRRLIPHRTLSKTLTARPD